MKKIYLMIFCLITILLSVTAISATNDTKIQTNTESTQTPQITNENPINSMENSKADNNKFNIESATSPTIKTSNTQQYEYTNTKNLKTESNSKNVINLTPTTFNQSSINDAQNNSDIYFSKGKYYLNSMIIDKNIRIIGENKTNTILIANSTSSIFTINKNIKISLINITLQDYNTDSNNTAIINNGILEIDNCKFQNNTGLNKSLKGGSIYNTGTLTVSNSEFMNNYASWGASIYNNNGTVVLNKSEFSKESTLNVGGSTYNIHGIMNIYDCLYLENNGVSGAAIYNAFGLLNVNNSKFIKNNAISFYGGAIYNTGITNVNNSQFLYNHATYDGGAITNTNNFTATNCSFEVNTAGGSGGCIENIAWTENENGNLTLLYCNFTENSAGVNGGAIVNLNTTPVAGNYGTVTARNCIFEANSAGEVGGAICNNQYINLEYNVFVDNDASTSNTIYSLESTIKSVENNWWSSNNPKWDRIGVTPKTWVIMTFTNTTTLLESLDTKLIVTLNSLNNNKKLEGTLPLRSVVYLSENSTFQENFQEINATTTNKCSPGMGNISAKIDNQKISLQPVYANISYILINNNQTIKVIYNLPKTIDAKSILKINGKTATEIFRITNGKKEVIMDIPGYWNNKNYMLRVILVTRTGESLIKDINLTIPKRDVTTNVSIISNKTIKVGDTIQIVAHVMTGNKNVTGGKVVFKINGKTIKTNVKVKNGVAIINYTIPYSFNPKNYNLTVQYSGSDNKNVAKTSIPLVVSKQDVHPDVVKPMQLLGGTTISSIIGLLDTHNNYVSNGKVCYKINNKTIKTNISLTDGVFTFDYTTPEVPPGKKIHETLTIIMGENKKYNAMRVDIPLIIY